MIDLFTPSEAVTMDNFNKRLTAIREALPDLDLKIATGSYVGTGNGGSISSATTLSFNFVPKILIVANSHTEYNGFMVCIPGCTYAVSYNGHYGSSAISHCKNKVLLGDNGKTIRWCNENFSSTADTAYGQQNIANVPYWYFAIGT